MPSVPYKSLERTEMNHCPHCGAKIETAWKFCAGCGADLAGVPEPTPTLNQIEPEAIVTEADSFKIVKPKNYTAVGWLVVSIVIVSIWGALRYYDEDAYLARHKSEMNANYDKEMADIYAIAGGKDAFEAGAKTYSDGINRRWKMEQEATPWIYSSEPDPMSKGIVYLAMIKSSNVFEFSSPYDGPQKATLIIRRHPRWGNNVILQIERGQLLVRSYEDMSARVRFDDGNPQGFAALGAEDNSTENAFLSPYSRFVDKLSKANRVRISLPIYQEGSPVFEFSVKGFDPSKLKPAK